MRNRFDQLGKRIGLSALGPSGLTVAQDEIASDPHHADLRHEPDPARGAERARLGLLGRIVSVVCLVEIFSGVPDEEESLASLGKLIAFRQQRLRVGIVVASELPRDRSTILVRIMAGGTALPAALADLAALPEHAWEREVASMDVLELRRALGSKPNRTVDEEEFIVSTQNIMEELRNEGRASALLTVLQARGIPVSDAARARILAQQNPDRLDGWLQKAVVASSLTEVFRARKPS